MPTSPNKESSPYPIARDPVVGEMPASVMARLTAENEISRFVEASTALFSSSEWSQIFDNILGLAQRFIAADAYAVWQRQENGAWRAIAAAGLSDKYPRETLSTEEEPVPAVPTLVEDIRSIPLVRHRLRAYENEGIRSLLIVPLPLREAGATLVFYYRSKRKLSEHESRLASSIGNLAAVALTTAQLNERQNLLLAEAAQSEKRAKLLADAGTVLSSSLDYETTLANVAKLAVPVFADWCSVDLLVGPDTLQQVAVQHTDPEKIRLAQQLREQYPPLPEDPGFAVCLQRQPIFVREIPAEALPTQARDDEHLRLLSSLGLRSVILAPIVAGEHALGVLTFVTAESGRLYEDADLQVAAELGRRAANAIVHARLFQNAKDNEDRLRLAANAARVGIWERDLATEQLSTSPQCSVNLGIRPGETISYPGLLSRIYPEDRPAWEEAVDRAITGHGAFESEYRIRWPDDTLHWILAYGQCVYGPDGSARRMVGAAIDVTHSKRAEEERKELLVREKEARRTAELLNRIGPALVSELDPLRLMRSVTGIATRLTGAQLGAFVNNATDGGQLPALYSVPGAAQETLQPQILLELTPLLASTLQNKETVRYDDVTQQESYGRDSSGIIFPGVSFTIRSYLAAPVVTRSGETRGALLFAHEQSARFSEHDEQVVQGICAQAAIAIDNAKLFEQVTQERERVIEANQALKRTNESLRQFAYAAAHDLKEPLRMVSLYSQMLTRLYKNDLDDRAGEFLTFIRDGSTRMQALVDDLLAFTQAGETLGEAPRPVDLNQALEVVLVNLRAAIEESGATITWDNLPVIMAHDGSATQVFQNLISNAVKYRRLDQAPRVVISAQSKEREWLFRVQDNGIGIAPQYHEQIFGIFKRLHQNEYPGTGIGLAICQRVVERHGGTIWVESEEGSGSAFLFTWPKELR